MKRQRYLIQHFQYSSLLAAGLMLFIVMTGTGLVLANDDKANSRDRFTEVDREIQAVKQEVLEINREILLLEQEVLYPHGQQVVVFVSLTDGSLVNVDNIALQLDGKTVSQHVYSQSEKTALNNGGVHRLYVGRLQDGTHVVDVALSGRATDGQQFLREQSAKIVKGSGRKVMELTIAAGDNATEPQFTIHQW